jgi:hypothetical protein
MNHEVLDVERLPDVIAGIKVKVKITLEQATKARKRGVDV